MSTYNSADCCVWLALSSVAQAGLAARRAVWPAELTLQRAAACVYVWLISWLACCQHRPPSHAGPELGTKSLVCPLHTTAIATRFNCVAGERNAARFGRRQFGRRRRRCLRPFRVGQFMAAAARCALSLSLSVLLFLHAWAARARSDVQQPVRV